MIVENVEKVSADWSKHVKVLYFRSSIIHPNLQNKGVTLPGLDKMLPVNIIKAAIIPPKKSGRANIETGRLLLPGYTYRLHSIKACNLHTLSPTLAHTNTLKPQHLKLSSLSPNTPGNVFLLWGGLSGVVHWSQPSVINCHNASKLTNGLCVKEGPLIYWPPLVDPEPIISITAGFHVWASSPAKPPISLSHFAQISWNLSKGLVENGYRHTPCNIKVCALYGHTHIVCFWTHFISHICIRKPQRRNLYYNVISCDAGRRQCTDWHASHAMYQILTHTFLHTLHRLLFPFQSNIFKNSYCTSTLAWQPEGRNLPYVTLISAARKEWRAISPWGINN